MPENADTSDKTRLYQMREIANDMTPVETYRMDKETLLWLLGMIPDTTPPPDHTLANQLLQEGNQFGGEPL